MDWELTASGLEDAQPKIGMRAESGATRLEYLPWKAATNAHTGVLQKLSGSRSDAIGVVIPNLADPYFALIAAAIEAEAEREGIAAIMTTCSRTMTSQSITSTTSWTF